MITAYLIRAIVIGGFIGFAATLLEYALGVVGRPRRYVWLAALAVATIIPAAGA